MIKWLVFSDGSHAVDGDKAVCGASIVLAEGKGFGARPVAVHTCADCLKAVHAAKGAASAPAAAPAPAPKKSSKK